MLFRTLSFINGPHDEPPGLVCLAVRSRFGFLPHSRPQCHMVSHMLQHILFWAADFIGYRPKIIISTFDLPFGLVVNLRPDLCNTSSCSFNNYTEDSVNLVGHHWYKHKHTAWPAVVPFHTVLFVFVSERRLVAESCCVGICTVQRVDKHNPVRLCLFVYYRISRQKGLQCEFEA